MWASRSRCPCGDGRPRPSGRAKLGKPRSGVRSSLRRETLD
jgi:hypothetical protein